MSEIQKCGKCGKEIENEAHEFYCKDGEPKYKVVETGEIKRCYGSWRTNT